MQIILLACCVVALAHAQYPGTSYTIAQPQPTYGVPTMATFQSTATMSHVGHDNEDEEQHQYPPISANTIATAQGQPDAAQYSMTNQRSPELSQVYGVPPNSFASPQHGHSLQYLTPTSQSFQSQQYSSPALSPSQQYSSPVSQSQYSSPVSQSQQYPSSQPSSEPAQSQYNYSKSPQYSPMPSSSSQQYSSSSQFSTAGPAIAMMLSPSQQYSSAGGPSSQQYSSPGTTSSQQYSAPATSSSSTQQQYSTEQYSSPASQYQPVEGSRNQQYTITKSAPLSMQSKDDNGLSSTTRAESGAVIHKHVYVHVPPPEIPETRSIKSPPPAPAIPEKHYKILFIKAPEPPTPTFEDFQFPPEPEQKTLVYVLVKKPEAGAQIRIPTPAPTKPSKPEVYFIRYKSPATSLPTGGGGTGSGQFYTAPPSSPSSPPESSQGYSYTS